MGGMKINLAAIEERIQSFVEDSLAVFPWGKRKDQIAPLLMATLRGSLVEDTEGNLFAPSLVTIFVHPSSLPEMLANQSGLETLARILNEACQEAGIRFRRSPVIRVASSYDLGEDEIRVHSTFPTDEVVSQTAAIDIPHPEISLDTRPINAFLIVNGAEVIPLRMVVINLGRRTDNHIVIDDPRVSRKHAQLRAVRNQYVIFDLNSSGGTYVNGQRISQVTLKPGDVISLAGVAMIYGEDNPQSGSDHKTPTSDIKPLT